MKKRPRKPKKKSKIELRNDKAKEYILGDGVPALGDACLGELLELCRHVGLSAHKGMGTEAIVALLDGEEDPEASPVDKVRDRMGVFMKLYWDRVTHQLPDGCDGDCYKCSDVKVISCFRENAGNLFT
jgi:hypothetical protein